MRRSFRNRGQGMTEYIIIVAVVAILSLAVILKFGNQIRDLFFTSGSQLAGEEQKVTNKMDAGDVDKSSIKDL